MLNKGILATLVAKDGKQDDVEEFLRSAPPLIQDEPGTKSWYAIRLSDLHYGIFESFEDEENRDAHVHGKVAQALLAMAPELFSEAPMLENIDILASSAK